MKQKKKSANAGAGPIEDPVWSYDQREESEVVFLALAARHHAGHQQHVRVQDLNPDDSSSDDDIDDLEDDASMGRSMADSRFISRASNDPAHATKKECFLNNVAELLARKKDPGYIACTVMYESTNDVRIFATRNQGFASAELDQRNLSKESRRDTKFFTELTKQSLDMQNGCGKAKVNKLFELLLDFYQARFCFHVKQLVEVSETDESALDHMSAKQRELLKDCSCLRKLCRVALQKDFHMQRARDIAERAYALSRDHHVSSVLTAVYGAGQATQVFRQLRFVARIRAIHLSFVDCIKTLPSFRKIVISPLPYPGSQQLAADNVRDARSGARKAMENYLGTVPRWFDDGHTQRKLQDELRKRKLVIHAEMQMVCWLKTANLPGKPFPYLGISKKPCHMCDIFLNELKEFKRRQCHGQLHPYCTLPRNLDLSQQGAFALRMAVNAVKQNLAELAGGARPTPLPLRPESTTVWTPRTAMSSRAVSVITQQTAGRLPLPCRVPDQIYRPASSQPLSQALSLRSSPAGTPVPQQVVSEMSLVGTMYAVTEAHKLKTQLEFLLGLLKLHRSNLPKDVQKALPLLELSS